MRASSYNIIVNVDRNTYAILNGYTQAFDIISKDVYDYINNQNNGTINISEKTVDKLIKRGYLTSLNQSEELELIKRITDNLHKENILKKCNFQFIISYDCNFRCSYCFENDVLNKNCPSKAKIDKAKIDKAFEVIYEKYKNKQCSPQITLYGGEPFLAENYDIISYIIEKGKKCGFAYFAPSNGYDLDRYFDIFEKEELKFMLQITLDGIDDIQNAQRPHYINDDSFDKVTRNIDYLLKIGININLRINLNAHSLERIDELMSFIKEKKWSDYNNFNAYWALLREEVPIIGTLGNVKNNIKQLDLIKTYQEKKIKGCIAQKVSCQDYGATSLLRNLILGKDIPYKGYFCGAQSNNIIFDPLGNLYTCWDVVGQVEHSIGKYMPDFQIDDDAKEKWFNNKISDHKCLKCKYVLFCGGGCVVRSLNSKQKINLGNCNQYPQIFNYNIKQFYNESLKPNITNND